jgi:hypothetical protein
MRVVLIEKMGETKFVTLSLPLDAGYPIEMEFHEFASLVSGW